MDFEHPDIQGWELNEQVNSEPPFEGEQRRRLLRAQETQIATCIGFIEKMREELEEIKISHREELRALQHKQEKIAKEMNCIDNRLQDNEVHFEREKAEQQKIIVQNTAALFNLEQALKVRRLDDSCRIQVERLAEDNRDALSALKKNLIELVSLGEQSTLTKVDAILEALEITLCDKQIQKDIALNDRIERLAAQTDALLHTTTPAINMANAELIATLILDKLHSTGRNVSLSQEIRKSDPEVFGNFTEHHATDVTDAVRDGGATAEKSYAQFINRIAQFAFAAQAIFTSTRRKLANLAAEMEGIAWGTLQKLFKIPSDTHTLASQTITRLSSQKHLRGLILFVREYPQLTSALWVLFVARSRSIQHGVLAAYRSRLMNLSFKRAIYVSVIFLTFLGSLSYFYWLIQQSAVHQDLNGRRIPRRVRKTFYVVY